MSHRRTNSGRDVEVLMRAEDEGEEVYLVRYEGEPGRKTDMRHFKSFLFDSNSGPGAGQPSPNHSQVLISIVGVNYDIDDGQVDAIKRSLSKIIHDVPFTMQFDHIEEVESQVGGEELELMEQSPSITISKETAKPTTTEAPSETLKHAESLKVTGKHMTRGLSVDDLPEVTEEQRKRRPSAVEVATINEIVSDLQSLQALNNDDDNQILNPFGEPLTDADIQYAFEKADENNDRRIQFKEFEKCVIGLGLEVTKKSLKELFQKLDADNNKILDLDEFRTALNMVQQDNVEIWSRWLSMSTLDMKPGPNDPSVEEIAKILNNKRAPWADRIEHMHYFAKKAVQKMPKKKFDALMRPVREPLINQLQDRRSAVVRECCIVIAKIAMVQEKNMTRWAPRILEALFFAIRQKVDIIAVSAHQAAKAIVRCVPDSKKLDLLKKLKAASIENYIIMRQRAFEYLAMMIRDTKENGTKRPGDFWTKSLNMVEHGVQDASIVVREEAQIVACWLYLLNPTKVEEKILKPLRKAQQKAFRAKLEEFRIAHS